ncbi:MAG: hypothetical protein RMA76_21605 [Deltaproteobacteria bacterium]|jgi:plasmid stability protein
MKRLVFVAALLTFACDETDECRRLDRIQEENDKVLDQARRRAKQADVTEKRLSEMKAKADEAFEEYGLNLSEKEVTKALEARAKDHGATVERGTREIDSGINPGGPGGGGGTQTMWTFTYPSKSMYDAWRTAEKIMAVPPFVRFASLRNGRKRGTYLLEAVRGTVDRAPMKVEPTPLPKLRDPADVPSQFGFCGAAEKRQALAALAKEVEELTPQAEALTVNLPLAASWEGLWKRTIVIRDIEDESRRITREVFESAERGKVPLKAAGIENDIVIVELVGGKKERGRVERELPKALVEQLQTLDGSGQKIERLMIVNRHAEKKHEAEQKLMKAIELKKRLEEQKKNQP